MAVADGRGEGEPRVERAAGCRQQLPAAREVDAVVGVSPSAELRRIDTNWPARKRARW